MAFMIILRKTISAWKVICRCNVLFLRLQHLAEKFQFYKKYSLELSVDIFNVLNMLNKDWGAGHNWGAQKTYTIKGFDKEKKV